MPTNQKAHKRAIKSFRMICNNSGSVHMFKAPNINTAIIKARQFFNGPVSSGGIIVE